MTSTSAQPPSMQGPSRRARVFRAVWVAHRVLGLGLGALLVLMSLSGSLLVMHDDLERLLLPERVVTMDARATSTLRSDVRTNLTQLEAIAPEGYRPLRLEPAHAPDEADTYLFVAPDGRARWAATVAPKTGAVLWSGPDQSRLTSWVLHLHMHLRIGGWGYIVTGAAGAALLLLGLSGLYLHRRPLLEAFVRPLRVGRGWRVVMSDLHRWLGVGSIYFSLVLGTTGLIYAIKIAPGQIAAPKPLPERFDTGRFTAVEPLVASALAQFPGSELLRVAFPTRAKAPLTVTVLHRDAPVWRKFSRIDFDPVTGEVRAVKDASAASRREKFVAMLGPLHFGFYGSRLTQWAYCVGGLTPALLALSGAAIWLLRRRKKMRLEG